MLADSTKFGVDIFYTAIRLAECHVITEAYHELLGEAKGYTVADPIADEE